MKKLTLIDKAFLLKRTPLFSSLDLDILLVIADKLAGASFEPNDIIFQNNEDANRMYFIVKGKISLNVSSDTSIELKDGDFFGEESLFNNKPRSYSAISREDALILTLTRTNLYNIMLEYPSVALGFLQVYTSIPFRPIK